MKKKIDIQDLEMGMYVSELDRPWIDSPFLFQGFQVQSDQEMAEIQKHCSYVYIDIELGPDVSPSHQREALQRTQKLEQRDKKIKRELKVLTQSDHKRPSKPYKDQVSFEEELAHAKELETESNEVMQETIEQVRTGKDVNIEKSKVIVGKMVDSVIRNPDSLVCLSQLKDASLYTAQHSIRTSVLALAFGRHMVMSKAELNALGLGAFLHDIGMAKLPQELLDKPGPLNVQEFNMMRTHVPRGTAMLQKADFSEKAIQVVAQHHERHDGSGYPKGIKDSKFTIFGAIGVIVDVYDALTSQTTYREGLSPEDVLKSMYEWRHKDFHQKLVEGFIRCMGIFPIGSLVELNTGSIGVVMTINRSRRLKPKVSLALTADKQPYSAKVVTDLSVDKDNKVGEIKIKRVLPSGAFGINPMAHLVKKL